MSANEEKLHEVEASQSSSTHDAETASDLDAAFNFINGHHDASDSVDIAAVRRKIDWHIVPLMFLCYTMQFLDKVILNVSENQTKDFRHALEITDSFSPYVRSTPPSWA